jgi:hypothetical protein
MAEPTNPDRTEPNRASNKEPAEGSRENVNVEQAGITNRPIEEEQREQQNLPPRGRSREDADA